MKVEWSGNSGVLPRSGETWLQADTPAAFCLERSFRSGSSVQLDLMHTFMMTMR